MKNKIFFGFALADEMFASLGDCTISRKTMEPEEVKKLAEEGALTPCLNPSHEATINAMGLNVPTPEKAPFASLNHGDSVIVMGVRTDRHEYTEDEIASATFQFSMYTVE
ncbi:hypothetical protein IJ096_03445 [Candidatus Saccharibacteria bacterium]|nr:hypothetical protein [Candidatus Saccharibacteria bacterium]